MRHGDMGVDTMTIDGDAFVAAAEAALAGLLPGATRSADPDDFTVTWSTPRVDLFAQYDATRSRELVVGLELRGGEEPSFEVADVLRATDCPDEDTARVELVQTSDLAVLQGFLSLIGHLLRRHAGPFLRGNEEAFTEARELRAVRAREYMARVVSKPLIDRAEQAWTRGDYREFRDILTPVAHLLDKRLIRRLEYVDRRMSASPPGHGVVD